jgi:hypothetical protein
MNENYHYWDKIKYQRTPLNIQPEILRTLIKLSRVINAKKLNFGNHRFSFNLTDQIQKGLHEFDLNIGGSLGAKSIVPEEDKKRHMISSVMEEAIASSQIEGAVTTRS